MCKSWDWTEVSSTTSTALGRAAVQASARLSTQEGDVVWPAGVTGAEEARARASVF